jgi:hypothetical protein
MTAGPDSNAPNLRDLPAPVVTTDLRRRMRCSLSPCKCVRFRAWQLTPLVVTETTPTARSNELNKQRHAPTGPI